MHISLMWPLTAPVLYSRCQVCPAEEDPVEAAESTPQTEPREAASPDIEPEPQEEPEPQRAAHPLVQAQSQSD